MAYGDLIPDIDQSNTESINVEMMMANLAMSIIPTFIKSSMQNAKEEEREKWSVIERGYEQTTQAILDTSDIRSLNEQIKRNEESLENPAIDEREKVYIQKSLYLLKEIQPSYERANQEDLEKASLQKYTTELDLAINKTGIKLSEFDDLRTDLKDSTTLLSMKWASDQAKKYIESKEEEELPEGKYDPTFAGGRAAIKRWYEEREENKEKEIVDTTALYFDALRKAVETGDISKAIDIIPGEEDDDWQVSAFQASSLGTMEGHKKALDMRFNSLKAVNDLEILIYTLNKTLEEKGGTKGFLSAGGDSKGAKKLFDDVHNKFIDVGHLATSEHRVGFNAGINKASTIRAAWENINMIEERIEKLQSPAAKDLAHTAKVLIETGIRSGNKKQIESGLAVYGKVDIKEEKYVNKKVKGMNDVKIALASSMNKLATDLKGFFGWGVTDAVDLADPYIDPKSANKLTANLHEIFTSSKSDMHPANLKINKVILAREMSKLLNESSYKGVASPDKVEMKRLVKSVLHSQRPAEAQKLFRLLKDYKTSTNFNFDYAGWDKAIGADKDANAKSLFGKYYRMYELLDASQRSLEQYQQEGIDLSWIPNPYLDDEDDDTSILHLFNQPD